MTSSLPLPLVLCLVTMCPSRAVVLQRPPASNLLTREPPVTSSDLPKQIPAPPAPPHPPSTPHYDQQLARLLWVTNTPYPVPVYHQWK